MEKIPLILIPGLLCDQALWESQAAALGPVADCMVTDKHLRYETIGQIATAITAGAPARFALAGLSMGGYIALEICRRFGNRVDRLALLDTSARSDTPAQMDRRKELMALCRKGRFDEVVEMLLAVLIHPDRHQDPELKGRVRKMAKRIGPNVFIRQQRAIMGRIDQVPNLSAITCPTLVVCGEQDKITPLDCAEEMAGQIAGSRLAVIRGSGHLSTMEKPGKVAEIMHQWLAGND